MEVRQRRQRRSPRSHAQPTLSQRQLTFVLCVPLCPPGLLYAHAETSIARASAQKARDAVRPRNPCSNLWESDGTRREDAGEDSAVPHLLLQNPTRYFLQRNR